MTNDTIKRAVREYLAESADGQNSPKARAKWGPMEEWDTSQVTSMRRLFYFKDEFSLDLSAWDVGRVADMHRMFEDATAFTSDLSAWDVGRVTDTLLPWPAMGACLQP